MFDTNIQNNSMRISLARAAQLTGYHQDYLGQLCRLGKLRATKIGRNWFTSPEALNSLQEPSLEEQDAAPQMQAPVIAENITITAVDEMPIAIRTVPPAIRNTNSVQGILTNLRIENLQEEVLELRRLLYNLMEEVKSHTTILEAHETINRVQDSLKHSYISNFELDMPSVKNKQLRFVEDSEDYITEPPDVIHVQPTKRPGYALSHWAVVTIALAAISFITVTLATAKFLGSEPQTTVIYHHSENQPEVAGAVTIDEP